MQIILDEEPYSDRPQHWIKRGEWPAKWVGHPSVKGTDPAVTAYRKRFTLEKRTKLRIHVSADERYELFLDGSESDVGHSAATVRIGTSKATT